MSLSFTFYRKNFGERWVPFCNHSAFINSVLQQKWGLKILICLHFLNLMGFVHSSFLMITPMLSVDCIAIKILYTIKHDKYTVINLPHFFEWKAKKSSLFCNKDTRHSRNCLILLIACNDKMHPCKQYTGINIWIAFVCAALVAVWCLTDSKIWPLLVIIFCPDWSIMGGLCAIRESCMLNVLGVKWRHVGMCFKPTDVTWDNCRKWRGSALVHSSLYCLFSMTSGMGYALCCTQVLHKTKTNPKNLGKK